MHTLSFFKKWCRKKECRPREIVLGYHEATFDVFTLKDILSTPTQEWETCLAWFRRTT